MIALDSHTDHQSSSVGTREPEQINKMKVLVGLLLAAACIAAEPISFFDYPFGRLFPQAFPTTYTVPVVKPDGFLADTPEVQTAKALHFAEWEAARARTFSPITPFIPSVAPIDYNRYISPVVHSHVPFVSGGFLPDTPEVAAEKARHFAEVAKAKARLL